VSEDQGSRPLIEVTRGQPSPEEIAALSAVVSAILSRRNRAAAEAEARRRSPSRPGWPDRAARLRAPLVTGPGAWRHSTRPR
jgi:Acyl-CoA carboxylase epsilon subunit